MSIGINYHKPSLIQVFSHFLKEEPLPSRISNHLYREREEKHMHDTCSTVFRTLLGGAVLSLVLALSPFPATVQGLDNNSPGPIGGPGTNWENPLGPVGGPGASPNRRRR